MVDDYYELLELKKNVDDVDELKGTVAFDSGVVEGVARVIFDDKKTGELKVGEILVTTMTNPEFVPAMKRSLGIITNEGGILCHAAILSRELRKPCVIATKNATDAIHTGDLVRLDSVSGVIKIIKRD